VTFEEGLQVLGVGEDSSADTVRRAYLRLVKQHKPDRDPDGFKRIREAFELVSASIAFRRHLNAAEGDEAPVDATRNSVPDPDGEHAEVAPTALERPHESELAPYLARVEKLRKKDLRRGAVAIWKEAVSAFPDSIEARMHLYDAYRALRWRTEAGQVALEAFQRGMTVFAQPLLLFHARMAPAELMEGAARFAELRALLPLAHVERGDLIAAIEVMENILKDAAASTEGAYLSTDIALRVIAKALSGDEPDRAHGLVLAFDQFLASVPSEARVLPGALAARWALLREVDRLRANLPKEVLASMAEATLPDETEAALGRLLSWAAGHSFRAPRVVKLLQKQSPELHGTFGPHLSPIRTSTDQASWRWWIFPLLVSMNAARLCSSGANDPARSSSVPEREQTPFVQMPSPPRFSDIEGSQSTSQTFGAGPPVTVPPPLDTDTCKDLNRRIEEMKETLAAGGDAETQNELNVLLTRFMLICRGESPEGKP
jgi:hypothetical protein